MRAVIQAVSSASVRVNGGEPRAIGPGLMILLGVKDTDRLDIVPKLADKCAGLRIFPDAEGKLNLSARDLGYHSSPTVHPYQKALGSFPADTSIASAFSHNYSRLDCRYA